MSKTGIWMPLFIGDYLGDTQRLTTEQHGAYLLIIIDYWRAGPPPDDDDVLRQITRLDSPRWKKHKPVLARLFQIEDGFWTHKRIDAELDAAQGNKEKIVNRAKKGAAAKWGNSDDQLEFATEGVTRSQRLAAAKAQGTHTQIEWIYLQEICGDKCLRCGDEERKLVKDHIKPIYQGGSDSIDNIQPLCGRCNCSKGPENKDFRPVDWKKCLQKCLLKHSPSPSPSEIDTNVSIVVKRKSKFPDAFVPIMVGITKDAVDRWPHHRIEHELAQFADYHKSRGSLMLDWQAAWRTWARNADKFLRRNSNGNGESGRNGFLGAIIDDERASRSGQG
jgi:uncharacterized protein YdaU (DUF1376 family)